MKTLICGSLAYDNIMVFADRFKNHILPEQIHILNVSFLVPEMRREFGGCAGNIAYSLKMLGGEPAIMATAGDDFDPYALRLDSLAIDQAFIRRVPGTYTAQAFITTDLDDNQITAFHPGAMNHSHLNSVPRDAGIELGIVAPDGRDGMLQHAREFSEAAIPFIFDPGQGLPMFNGDELLRFVDQADYIALNDYEAKLLEQRTGQTLKQLAERVRAIIVTLGKEGSHIYANGNITEIPCVAAEELIDPTGCGDAYRGGLLYGIAHQMDWQMTGRLAALMGAMKIATRGAQNYALDKDEIEARFKRTFGMALS